MIRNPLRLSRRTLFSKSTVTYKRAAEQPEAAQQAVAKVSRASNGITIATHDHFGPQSSVAIVVASGSRADDPKTPGVAHLLSRSLVRVLSPC